MDLITVVCGIIFKNNFVLICRRKPEKSLGGYWEFPGGKVEDGESDEESLRRELISFVCETENIASESTDHDQLEWVKVSDLLSWKLAPADIPIAKELIQKFKG
ncbi:MAG: NUDIX domain-containing protein [Sphingobacterium sp.]